MNAHRAIVAALVALLAACGGGGEAGPPPRLVVLIAVDDLRADHLPAYGYDTDPAPHLSALAAEGTVFTDHVTSSTALNASVASLLTGLDVDHHGVRSVHDVGRHRLPLACTTLAEEFQARGFVTLAAVSRRQLAGNVSGFSQGFDRYLDENLPDFLPRGEQPRRGRDVALDLLDAIGESLAEGRSVFAFLHLGDLGDSHAPDGPAFVARFRARLAARGVTPSKELEEAMASAADPTRSPWMEIQSAVGRRRGTPEWEAYLEADYDVVLAEVDEVVSRFSVTSGDFDFPVDVQLVVVGTRGRYLIESRPDGELEGFSEGLIRTACLVHPRVGDVARVDFPTDARDVAAVLRARNPVGFLAARQVESAGGARLVVVDSPRVGARAFVGPTWKAWQASSGDDCQVVRRADDRPATLDELPLGWFARAAAGGRDGYGLEVPEGWGLRVPGASARRTAECPPRDEELAPSTYRWRTRAPGFVVRAAGATLPSLPVPRLPGERGQAWEHAGEDPPPWVVDVAKTSGRNCAITVGEAAGEPGDDVRLWIVRYPADDGVEALEVTEGPGVRVLSEPTLPGATVVEGTLPFTVEVTRPSGARLALVVRVGDTWVDSARIRYLGRRFFAGDPELYFPPWLPQRMDWFLDGEAPLAAPSATIGFRRIGEAPVLEGRLDLNLPEALFLRRLGRNE